MKVFVIGATGAIGGHTVPALLRAGHTVTALARTPEKAAQLSKHGAAPISASLFDPASLTEAFKGHDAVVNLATAIPSTTKFMQTKAWTENDRVRGQGSAIVIKSAIAASIEHIVQESVSMIYPDRGDTWIDEHCPPDTFPMAQGNLAAEANANRFSTRGGMGVVLRFGWFYGPGAAHSEAFFALAHRHIVIMMGPPKSYVSSIHVADAAAAVVAALAVPAGTYNVVDDEPVMKRSYADALAAAAGKSAWLHLPGRAALLLGDRSTSLTRSLRVSNARFREVSGWNPMYPSVYQGWMATAKALNVRRSD